MCRTHVTLLIALGVVGCAFSARAAVSGPGDVTASAAEDALQHAASEPLGSPLDAEELRPMFEVDPGPAGVAMEVRTAQPDHPRYSDDAHAKVVRPFVTLEEERVEADGPGTEYARYEDELRKVLERDGGSAAVALEARAMATRSLSVTSGRSLVARADAALPSGGVAGRGSTPGAALVAVTGDAGEGEATCKMLSVNGDALSVATCLQCHPSHAGDRSHSVGGEYVQDERLSLRPIAEVVKRGIFLPGGQIHCLTCHDARSPWKNHIALPAGAVARSAVDPHSPATYMNASVARDSSAPVLPPGSAVTPTPLCMACHNYD
jgi:hypothetical protein